jgi:hypothetical protein
MSSRPGLGVEVSQVYSIINGMGKINMVSSFKSPILGFQCHKVPIKLSLGLIKKECFFRL